MSAHRLHVTPTWQVINKPAGMASCTQAGSALASVEAQYPGWYAVHRLDNDTSGCLLLAHSPELADTMRADFGTDRVSKIYLAIAHGLTPATLLCEQPIAHHPTNARRMVIAHAGQAIRGAPQPAHSVCTTLAQIPLHPQLGPLSLVRVQIATGVRHQIRVHLAAQGFPVVGDAQYSKHSAPGVAHHLLHAWQLSVVDPATDDVYTITAPLRAEMHSVFANSLAAYFLQVQTDAREILQEFANLRESTP